MKLKIGLNQSREIPLRICNTSVVTVSFFLSRSLVIRLEGVRGGEGQKGRQYRLHSKA